MSASRAIAGAAIVDAVCAWTLYTTGRGGKRVREYYRTYGASAAILDVSTMAVAAYAGIRVAPRSLVGAAIVAVAIQMAHDVGMGALFQKSRPSSNAPLPYLLAQYADEVGSKILVVDAALVVGTVVTTQVMVRDKDAAPAVAALGMYVLLMAVHSF